MWERKYHHDNFSDDTSSSLTLEIIEQILKNDPYNTTFLYKKVNLLIKAGQHASAIESIDILIGLLGSHDNLLNKKIFCLYELAQFKETQRFINAYSHEFYNSIPGSAIYGMVTHKSGDSIGAKRFFDVILADPLVNFDDLHVSLYSQALIKKGEYLEALYVLNDTLSSFYYISIAKGDAYFGLLQYEQAESHYLAALKMNPESFDAWLGLGKVYFNLKEYTKAHQYYQQAINMRPNDVDLLDEKNNIAAAFKLLEKPEIAGEEKPSEKPKKDASNPSSELKPEKLIIPPEEKKRERPKDMMEVDVPNDNNCLFWSSILAYLLPTLDHYTRFEKAYKILLGKQGKTNMEKDLHNEENKKSIFRLLKSYNVDKNSDIYKNPLMGLLCRFLRFRAVAEISKFFSKEHKAELARDVRKSNWREYAKWMKTEYAWGGESEIKAISNILKASVIVFSNNYNMEYIHKENDIPLYLVYTNATGKSNVTNHYHFLLNENLYSKHLKKKTEPRSPLPKLFKPKENDLNKPQRLDEFFINLYLV